MPSFVHAGVVVEDLTAAAEFFTLVGLDCGRPMLVEGEWVDRIVGLPGVRVEIVMVSGADGETSLELAKFHAPEGGGPVEADPAAPNRPGIRHISYAVDDLRAVVERLRTAGWDLVGDIVDYDGRYLLCYVRGPEGIIVELAQKLGAQAG